MREPHDVIALASAQDADRKRRVYEALVKSAKTVSIEPFSLDPNLRKIVPLEIARGYMIVAIGEEVDRPIIVLGDPNNYAAIDALHTFFPKGFTIAVAPRDQVLRAIDELYW